MLDLIDFFSNLLFTEDECQTPIHKNSMLIKETNETFQELWHEFLCGSILVPFNTKFT
jgi:hypothetical protein